MTIRRKNAFAREILLVGKITVQKRKDAPVLMLRDGTEGPEGGAIFTLKTNSLLYTSAILFELRGGKTPSKVQLCSPSMQE